ncbi:uncharacterized protein LOC141638279 [Silene latifolia]|uniref:uncharacterized protein LOC141638279 n=1 Tax=Silene latifolia TaxID=37657 RepID=UPI003D78A30A
MDGLLEWDKCTSELVGSHIFEVVPHFLTRKDVDPIDIYRAMPSLEHEDAARLTGAIEKKLSSVSSSDGCLETITKTSKKNKEMGEEASTLRVSRCFVQKV